MKPVYDGRADAKGSAPSEAEVELVRRDALPRAREHWRSNEACREEFGVIGAASGSFIKPNTTQRAVLYRFCTTGHNFATNGIAIIEDGRIIAHVLYEGGEDNAIGALADIDNNGLSEIVLEDGSTNQGYTVMVAIVIEVMPTGVKKFGIADVYEDDCGAREKCKMTAYKLSAKPGHVPIFYRETFEKRNEKWVSTGHAARYSLRQNEIAYTLVRAIY